MQTFGACLTAYPGCVECNDLVVGNQRQQSCRPKYNFRNGVRRPSRGKRRIAATSRTDTSNESRPQRKREQANCGDEEDFRLLRELHADVARMKDYFFYLSTHALTYFKNQKNEISNFSFMDVFSHLIRMQMSPVKIWCLGVVFYCIAALLVLVRIAPLHGPSTSVPSKLWPFLLASSTNGNITVLMDIDHVDLAGLIRSFITADDAALNFQPLNPSILYDRTTRNGTLHNV